MSSRVCLPRAVPPGPRSTIGVPSSRLQVTVGSGKPLQTKTKINKNQLTAITDWFKQTPFHYGRLINILSLKPATENEPLIWLFQKVY